ncbi:hypothetical protein ACFQDF_27280 [Ectobacillus funiculus]
MFDSMSISQVSITNMGMFYKFTKKENTFICTYCNGELLSRLGFTKQEDVIGRSLLDIFPAAIADMKSKYCQQAWEGQFIQYEVTFNDIYYAAFYRLYLMEEMS